MIESLMEIQIAYNMIDEKTPKDCTVHPLDTQYIKLNCGINVSYIITVKVVLINNCTNY